MKLYLCIIFFVSLEFISLDIGLPLLDGVSRYLIVLWGDKYISGYLLEC